MIRALARKRPPSAAEVDALALFQTLSELSIEAAEAVEANDGETLLRILAERARIMERTEELLALLNEELVRPGSDSAPSEAAGALLEAARELATLDSSLRTAIGAQRDALGRDLNALESGGAARSAYGGRQRGRDTINVVR